MVAAAGGVDLGGATKFAGADDDGVVEHFADAKLADEHGEGGVEDCVLPGSTSGVLGVLATTSLAEIE